MSYCKRCKIVIGVYFPNLKDLEEFLMKYKPYKTWPLESPKSGKVTMINRAFECAVCGLKWVEREKP